MGVERGLILTLGVGARGGDRYADHGDLLRVVLQLEGKIQKLVIDELPVLLVPEELVNLQDGNP